MSGFETINIVSPWDLDTLCPYAEVGSYYYSRFGTYIIIDSSNTVQGSHSSIHANTSLQELCCKSVIETLKCGKLLCRCAHVKLDQLVADKIIPTKLSALALRFV